MTVPATHETVHTDVVSADTQLGHWEEPWGVWEYQGESKGGLIGPFAGSQMTTRTAGKWSPLHPAMLWSKEEESWGGSVLLFMSRSLVSIES